MLGNTLTRIVICDRAWRDGMIMCFFFLGGRFPVYKNEQNKSMYIQNRVRDSRSEMSEKRVWVQRLAQMKRKAG